MAHALLHLQIHQELLGVIVRTLAQPVVAPESVDVARESGEIRACEETRAGAHDGLDHAQRVGVHTCQHSPPGEVSQKPDLPTRLDECIPARLLCEFIIISTYLN